MFGRGQEIVINIVIFALGCVIFCVEFSVCALAIERGAGTWRKDHGRTRFRHTLSSVFLQKRVRERWWGAAHVVIFYAFLVFLVGTIGLLAESANPAWRFGAWMNASLSASIDVISSYFAWLALVAVGVIAIRRIKMRQSVYNTFDAWLILSLIVVLMVSHHGIEASRLAMFPSQASSFLPLTYAVSQTSFVQTLAPSLYAWATFVHLLCVSFFLVWIPRGKHLHIVLGAPALYEQYRAYDEKGDAVNAPESIDIGAYEAALERAIEADKPESEWPQLGTSCVRDLTKKRRLEAFACTQCRRCTNACPMVAAQMNVTEPMKSVVSIRTLCMAKKESTLLNDAVMTKKTVWSCTQCGACVRVCPMGVEHTARVTDMRRCDVGNESFPKPLHAVFSSFERSANPWGYARSDRMKWAEGLSQTLAEPDESRLALGAQTFDVSHVKRILFWGGCMGAYDAYARKTTLHAVSWLKAQGFDVVALPDEMCCGEPLRKLGNEAAFISCRDHNLEAIAQMPHDIIVTTCPHCAQTLYHDYAEGNVRLRVMHILTFMAALFRCGNLEMAKDSAISDAPRRILHMPCGLCKTQSASDILRLTRALGIREADKDQTTAHCCGAGGGQFFIGDNQAISDMRVRELMASHPDEIVTACPFCVETLKDAWGRCQLGANGENALDSLTETRNVVDIAADLTTLSAAARNRLSAHVGQ